MATKYYKYKLCEKARAIYTSLAVATRPVDTAPTKYSVTLGLADTDAKALFALEREAVMDTFATWTTADDYQLCCLSGAKAADRVLASVAITSRGKPEDEAFAMRERAQIRADLLRPFAGVLTASSRTAFHDRFLDRYNDDLNEKERLQADKFGFRLGIFNRPSIIPLDNPLAFAEYKDKFYRGCYVVGSFNLSPWSRKKADDKDGVSAYLRNIVWVSDGERLSQERTMDDEFSHYQGQMSDHSPLTDQTVVDDQF